MKHIFVSINQDEVSYIERLSYESTGYRNLIGYLARQDAVNPIVLTDIQNKYIASNNEYMLALEEIRSKYVPQEYRNSKYQFELHYETCEMEIYEA